MGVAYPSLLFLSDDRLVCVAGYRVERGHPAQPCWTMAMFSDDYGCTWSKPQRINQFGDQANLCRLSDGRIVCVYGYRFVPFGLRGIVSEDEGKTWSREFVIRSDGGGPDLGYPVVTELPDKRILVVYYFNTNDGLDMEKFRGGRRFIGATTFRLK
jgi:hypothetical protein